MVVDSKANDKGVEDCPIHIPDEHCNSSCYWWRKEGCYLKVLKAKRGSNKNEQANPL